MTNLKTVFSSITGFLIRDILFCHWFFFRVDFSYIFFRQKRIFKIIIITSDLQVYYTLYHLFFQLHLQKRGKPIRNENFTHWFKNCINWQIHCHLILLFQSVIEYIIISIMTKIFLKKDKWEWLHFHNSARMHTTFIFKAITIRLKTANELWKNTSKAKYIVKMSHIACKLDLWLINNLSCFIYFNNIM